MTLITGMLHVVNSDELRIVPMNTSTAALIVAVLVEEGRAFYSEPWPDSRTRIFVDSEHEDRVRQLAKHAS